MERLREEVREGEGREGGRREEEREGGREGKKKGGKEEWKQQDYKMYNTRAISTLNWNTKVPAEVK